MPLVPWRPALQPVELPPELSCLQQLRELRVEYAQLDAVPPAVQVKGRGAWLPALADAAAPA